MSASVRGWCWSLGGVMCATAIASVLSIALADEPREGDTERPREGRAAEVGKLEQRLEQLEREVKELRESGKTDELESRQREFRGIRQRLEELRGDRREGDRREGDRREGGRPPGPSPEVRQRLEGLKSRIQELREAGKTEEAAQLQREAQEIMQRFAGGPRPGDGPRMPPEAREKLERMRAEVQRLREAGEPEKAAELEREVRAMMARFGGPGGPGGAAAQARLHHLRVAVEHLRAAGLNDAADRIEAQAKRLEQQDGALGERRPEKPDADREGDRERKEQLQKERKAGDAEKPEADRDRPREKKEPLPEQRKEGADRESEKPKKDVEKPKPESSEKKAPEQD
jgi:hypothetical protein